MLQLPSEGRFKTFLIDSVWGFLLAVISLFLFIPKSHQLFLQLSHSHVYLMAFVKFAILATMGELLVGRLVDGKWKYPIGLLWRAVIWGFLGGIIALVFSLYAMGVSGAMERGLLPSLGSDEMLTRVVHAIFTSLLMNMFFAPTFMAFHRITDTYIDLGKGRLRNIVRIPFDEVLDHIDWNSFITFVVCRTIPLFWIPAHTITFILPVEYRVLAAAFLSIVLGAILGFAKR